MIEDIEFTKENNYLLVRITDSVITTQRAHEILSRIGEECSSMKCTKVLLDERLVEKREVSSQKILELSNDMAKEGLNEIYIAFWCHPKLINNDSQLLSAFTYKNKYIIQHFSEKAIAVKWLSEKY